MSAVSKFKLVDCYMKALEELVSAENRLGLDHTRCEEIRAHLDALWYSFNREEIEETERRLRVFKG